MSVALCFLTVGNVSQPRLWAAFLSDAEGARVYCHPKFPDKITMPALRNGIIADRVPTEHGTASLVDATLNLFRAAYADERNAHFILLSETTIPVVPYKEVGKSLAECRGASLIRFSIPPPGSEHFRRQEKLPLGCRFDPFFTHDQWIILSRRHVGLLLQKPKLGWFSRMFAADEHYFMNVLAHSCGVKPNEILNQRKTFVNWNDRVVKEERDVSGILKRTLHPKTYDSLHPNDIAQALQQGCWFFRKVSSGCDCSEFESLVRPHAAVMKR